MKIRFVNSTISLFAALAFSACSGGSPGQTGGPGFGGMEMGSVGGAGVDNTGAGGDDGPGVGGAGGAGSGGAGVGGAAPGMGIDLTGSPQYYSVVRLTNAQWARSVQDILNLPAPTGLESGFQSAVAGTTAFNNNELVLDVDQRSWADFQTASETLADQVTASDAALASVYPATDAAGFIQSFGRRAFRRPLTPAEVQVYTDLYTTGTTMSGTKSTFGKGVALVIRGMLQSPYFLYRNELGAKGAVLSPYEIAAKLSLWLRGTTPSDALLDAAAVGALDTADDASTLALSMLAEPTATAVMRQFHGQLLHLDRYATIGKIGVPAYMDSLNAEYQESSYLFFDKIFTQGLGVKNILTSTSGFMGPGMAALYGLTPPPSGYVEHDLGPNRVGYFSQLPFLTLYGLNADPDSIHRGVSLNVDVLCAQLGPPAVTLPAIPPLADGQTDRQRISGLTSRCGGACHNSMINPLGFAFEHFDGMGQYRDTENGGLTVDSSGAYPFVEGTMTFSNAADLMQTMATTLQAHQCYAKKLASFALQRDIVATDTGLINDLAATSMAPNGSLKRVIMELVKSDAFRTRAGGAN